jgi:hypothetical protein
VVVDVHARGLPFAVREWFRRQWAQGGLIQPREQLGAADAVQAHAPSVELGQQLSDARVERGEREEGLVAQAREDPALGDLDGDLDLGLVPRAAGRAGRMAVP